MYKILIDLQSCQNSNKNKYVGSYSFNLTVELINSFSSFLDIHILLNGNFQKDVLDLRSYFEKRIGKKNIHVLNCTVHAPVLKGGAYLYKSAELIREEFVKKINPDFFLISSYFDGIDDMSLASVPDIPGRVGVIFHKINPILELREYSENIYVKKFYVKKIKLLPKKVDVIFTLSEFARSEIIDKLGVCPTKVINAFLGDPQYFQAYKAPSVECDKVPLDISFALFLADFSPKANHQGMLESFSIFKRSIKNKMKLVVASISDNVDYAEITSTALKFGISEKDLILTGCIKEEELKDLYRRSKFFVYPYFNEEYSLPCLEAMLCNTAVIGANTRSVSDIIDFDKALFDPARPNEIAECMERLLVDENYYKDIKENSEIQRKRFSWELTGKTVFDYIVNSPALPLNSINILEDEFFKNIKNVSSYFTGDDYIRLAKSIEFLYGNKRKLIYLDVTAISEFDAKTGIQRVVRSIIENIPNALISDVRLVRFVASGWYEFASNYQKEKMGFSDDEGVVVPFDGDIFIGLDLIMGNADVLANLYDGWRAQGVEIVIIVYDILPVIFPDFFREDMTRVFLEWLDMVSRCADKILCISKAVLEEVSSYIENNNVTRKLEQKIDYFHLGADFKRTETAVLNDPSELNSQKTFLMVGTIEPRKGYSQIIDAFELFEKGNSEFNLIIVGKPGWNSDGLIERLKRKNEGSNRIKWLTSVSDEELAALYQNSCALIAASFGEGFGLPLIEAAQYGLPVIARDIDVFREVAGDGAYYFKGNGSYDISKSLNDWVMLYKKSAIPSVEKIHWMGWSESVEIFFEKIRVAV